MSIFKIQGDNIHLDVQYCEFYIPMYYFDTTSRFAEDLNDRIQTLGVFNVGVFSNGKLSKMETLNLPTMITIFVHDSEVREIEMSNGEITPCKVIKYLKDSKVMPSRIIEDDSNAEKFLQLITSGKLPSIIPYSKLLKVWRKNQKLTGVHFGVSSLYNELVLAVHCRNPKNMPEKFSKVASDSGIGEYDYKLASTRQICQYNSTFTALTFEDIDSMITTSLNKSRNREKERPSPVEQIIKF